MMCMQCAAMCLLSAAGPPFIRVQSARVYEMRPRPRPHSQGPRPGSQSSQIFAVPFDDRSWDSPFPRPINDRQDPGRTIYQRETRACTQPNERALQAMDQMSGCGTCNLTAASGIGWVGWSRVSRAGLDSSNPAGGGAGDSAAVRSGGQREVRTHNSSPGPLTFEI